MTTMTTTEPVCKTRVYLDENGTACVDSPRNKVKLLAPMILGYGGVEETIVALPHLTRAQLHAVMSYYYDHQEEIDEAIRRDDEFEKEFRVSQAKWLAEQKAQKAMRHP